MALGKQEIAHVRQDIEEHRVLQLFVCIHQPFDSKDCKLIIRDIGVAIEVLALRTLTHGKDSESHFFKYVSRVQVVDLLIISLATLVADIVEILKSRVVYSPQSREIRRICNAESRIEFQQQNLDRIDVCLVEVVVICCKEVFQESNMLREPCDFLESIG